MAGPVNIKMGQCKVVVLCRRMIRECIQIVFYFIMRVPINVLSCDNFGACKSFVLLFLASL